MNKLFYYYIFVSIFIYASASLTFCFMYGNIQGSIWAALATILAGINFYLYRLYFSNSLHDDFRTRWLSYLNIFSFVAVLISCAFAIWYIFTIVYWKIPMNEYHRTPVFPCVFSFITGKWGLHLFTVTKELSDSISSIYAPLIQSI